MRAAICRRLKGPVLVLLAVLCYAAAIGQWSRLDGLPEGKHIVWQGTGDGLDGEACRQIWQNQKNDGGRCALWREKKGQTLVNPELSRTMDVTVWTVRGYAEVLFTDFVKLSEEDAEGCYVDRSAARELFGDADAVGMEVVWGERRLVIRGILEEGWPLVLARPLPEDTADRITLDCENQESEISGFLVQNALSGSGYDDSAPAGILKLLLLVFPAVLCTGLLREVLPRFRGAGGMLLLIPVFCILAVVFVGIPPDMIPDRWSNFEFWGSWWRTYRDHIGCFLEYGNSGRDTLRLFLFVRGSLLALLAPLLWRVKS